MVSGEFVQASKALSLGIIDHVIEANLVEGAVAFAQQVVNEKRPLRKIRDEAVPAPTEGFFEDFKNLR